MMKIIVWLKKNSFFKFLINFQLQKSFEIQQMFLYWSKICEMITCALSRQGLFNDTKSTTKVPMVWEG